MLFINQKKQGEISILLLLINMISGDLFYIGVRVNLMII